jgi:topoisomerase-4 subunit B
VGTKAVNALSNYFRVESVRDETKAAEFSAEFDAGRRCY